VIYWTESSNELNISSVPREFHSCISDNGRRVTLSRFTEAIPEWVQDLTELGELSVTDSGLHELPQWIGNLGSLTMLDLTGNQLTMLPDSLRNLTALKVLKLSNNRIPEVADWLGDLTDLTSLDLSANQFLEVPASLGSLTALRNLDLSGNNIGAVPALLHRLTALQTLGLAKTGLQVVPDWLKDLTDLISLDLGANKFIELPASLGSLTSLRKVILQHAELRTLPAWLHNLIELRALHLGGNRLTALPTWLGSLTTLTTLNLNINQLDMLPEQMGSLTALTTLNLSRNRLTELPRWLPDLSELTTLDLSGNRLTTLPEQIGSLSSLTTLDLSGNQLTELPEQIGSLSSLTTLDLSGNRLTELPGRLGDLLVGGMELNLDGNPLTEPVRGLAQRGASELAVFLRSLYDGEPHYEGKLLLVGEGNVGKTSLVAAMKGEPFISGRPTTHGIEISPLTFRHPIRDLDMTLRAWDFGGQEIYRVTHQFFFSPRAIYLVVWHARQGQEQDEVEGWLRRINLRVGRNAYLILVATHSAERLPELDYPQLKEIFREKLTLIGEFETDSSTGDGIPALKEAIRTAAARLPLMGQLISPRWTAAREEIIALASAEPQIRYDRFAEICERHNVTGEEITTLAKLMHDLGLIIYYGDDEGLRDVVVLNPEWLTKAISYVLEDDPTRQANGVLEHERLREIWQRPQEGYDPRFYPYFLRLMEKFDVSYRLEGEEGRSLVAQRVPYQRPRRLPWQPGSLPDNPVKSMRLVCRLAEPAPGFIPWLIVRHQRASTGTHWQRGMFLRHPIAAYESEAILELRGNVELVVDVRAPYPDMYFNVLRDSIENLIAQRWPGLRYDLLIPCPEKSSLGAPCLGYFSLNGLQRIRSRGQTAIVPCQTCGQVSDIFSLLTGFSVPSRPLAEVIEHMSRQLAEMSEEISEMRGLAADIAGTLRRVHRVVSAEVPDCPSMFTLAQEHPTGAKKASLLENHYRLTLWCEHPEYPHPWMPATYELNVSKEWFARASHYMKLVFRVLQLVHPLAGSLAVALLPEGQLGLAKICINEMEAVLTDVPEISESGARKSGTSKATRQLTIAEGEGLRALRALVFEHDIQRAFGGLRRVQNETGEFLWVCEGHYPEYDPGLPDIP
jgi:internalin A